MREILSHTTNRLRDFESKEREKFNVINAITTRCGNFPRGYKITHSRNLFILLLLLRPIEKLGVKTIFHFKLKLREKSNHLTIAVDTCFFFLFFILHSKGRMISN